MGTAKAADELYGIYELWHQPFWETSLFWLIIASIVLLLMMLLLWRLIIWYRLKEKNMAPWDVALRDLNCLVINDSPSHFQAKQFYFSLTAIVKKYLSARYTLNMNGATDLEVIALMENYDIPSDIFLCVKRIFTGCLHVKYASEEALKEQLLRDRDYAVRLVKATKLSEKKNEKKSTRILGR